VAGALRALLLAAQVLLVACGTVTPSSVDWPEELPRRSLFVAAWEADAANRQLQDLDNYLDWVQRFYIGNNLVPGWTTMTRELQARVTPLRWQAVEPRMQALGERIAAEWAKDNSLRRINTRCAAVWRDALQESLVRDDLDGFLTRLEADVTALLDGSLVADQIRFERYYVDEFDS
jgi:hypothetical protein